VLLSLHIAAPLLPNRGGWDVERAIQVSQGVAAVLGDLAVMSLAFSCFRM
jgi:hypothetical protein